MGLTRGMDPDTLTEMAKPLWYPIMLVYLDWPSTPVRVHSGVGSISYDGETWLGVGAAGEISIPGEGIGAVSGRATLTIYGETSALLTAAGAAVRNRAGAIYLGALTARAGNTLAGDPVEMFRGYMDALRFTVTGADNATRHALQVDLGSGPSARQMASVKHSAEDQALRYPGDTAGRHLINIEARVETMRWPAS